jgi:hypothetical protein
MGLDRFEYGFPDPQEEDIKELCACTYEWCNNAIYFGEINWHFDGEWFCSSACLAKYLGATESEAF